MRPSLAVSRLLAPAVCAALLVSACKSGEPGPGTTVPLAPTGLTATGGDKQVDLSWNPSGGALSYAVLRGAAGAYTQLATPTATRFLDTGLADDTDYTYVVRALNAAGSSGDSLPVTAHTNPGATSLAAPASLTATGGRGRIDLAWPAVAAATGYKVLRSTLTGGPYAAIASPTGTAYGDTGLPDGATYYYVVQATNAAGHSPNSPEAHATTSGVGSLPAVPTGLTATGGQGKIDLAWSAAAGATSYKISGSAAHGGPYALVGTSTQPGYTESGLGPQVTRFYVVQAHNAAGDSTSSAEASATTLLALLPAPTGLAATSGTGTVTLTWGAVAGASSYVVQRSDQLAGPFADLATGVATSTFTDGATTPLADGATHYYLVMAVNAGGRGAASAAVAGSTLPGLTAPTISSAAVSPGAITVFWSVSANATNYQLKRGTSSSGPFSAVGPAVSATSSSDVTVAGNTRYFYVVDALAGSAVSPDSAPFGALSVPSAPAGITTVGGASTITLNWSSGDAAPPDDYQVFGADIPGSGYGGYTAPLTTTTSTTFTETGLASGKVRYYVVRARNASGLGKIPTEQQGIAAVGTPSLTITGITTSSGVSLGWSQVGGATAYTLERSLDGSGFTAPTVFAPCTATSTLSAGAGCSGATAYIDGTVAPGTLYYYRVRSTTPIGPYSPVQSALTQPVSPANLAATAGTKSISLSWGSVAGETGYQVLRGPTKGSEAVLTSVTSTTYVDSGLTDGATYYYEVTALNASGSSSPSNEVFTTTLPGAISNLSAAYDATASGGAGGITLTWPQVPSASSYDVFRSLTPGGENLSAAAYDSVTGTTGYTDLKLTAGATYYYKVVARNPGAGPGSNEASAPVPPRAPSPVATAGDSLVTLTWTQPAQATSYRLFCSTSTGTYDYSNPAASQTSTGAVSAPITTCVPAKGGNPAVSIGTNTRYYFVARAAIGSSESVNSTEVSATTLPAPVSNLVATASTDPAATLQVTLTFTPSPGATGYNVYRTLTGGSFNFSAPLQTNATGTPVVDTTVANGTSYDYALRALSSAESQVASNVATALTLPAKPSGFQAQGGNDTITLTWNALAASPSSTAYNLTSAASAGGPYTALASPGPSSCAAGHCSYIDTGLGMGVTRYYQLTASDATGNASPAGPVNATTIPAAPINLQVASNMPAGEIDLLWTAAGGEQGFFVYRSATSTGLGSGAALATCYLSGTSTPGCSSSRYNDTGLADGATWYYAVQGFNLAGKSISSNTVRGQTLPAVPQGLTASALDRGAQLQFTLNAQGTDSYDLFQSQTSGSGFVACSPTSTPGSPVVVNGLVNGSTWYFEIRGRNSAGTSATSTQATVTLPPSAPALTLAPGDGQITLSWNIASGTVSGYHVYRGTASGGEVLSATSTCSASPCTYPDTGLVNGTTYYYRLTAFNAGGDSKTPSVEVSATPVGASVLNPPTGVFALGLNSKVNLVWSAPSGTTPTGYQLYRSSTANDPSPALLTTLGPVTSFTDTGVTNQSTYYYRLASLAASTTSTFSGEVSATPAREMCMVVAENGGALAFDADANSTSTTGAFFETTIRRSFGNSTLLQQAYALAIDGTNDEIVVLSGGFYLDQSALVASAAIVTYPRTWTLEGTAMAPLRMIAGSATGIRPSLTTAPGLGSPGSLALDPVHGEIFVLNKGSSANTVTVYSRTQTGNAAPIRTINLTGTTSRAIAIDTATDQLVVLDPATISWYPRNSSGTPTLAGSVPGITSAMVTGLSANGLVALTIDTRDSTASGSRVWVSDAGTNYGTSRTFFLEFAPGGTAPLNTLRSASGPSSTTDIYKVDAIAFFQDPTGAAGDSIGFVSSINSVGAGELVKACPTPTTCTVRYRLQKAAFGNDFNSSNATGAIAMDPAHGERFITTKGVFASGGGSVNVFSRTDVQTPPSNTAFTPLRTIDGPNSHFNGTVHSAPDAGNEWQWILDSHSSGSGAPPYSGGYARALPGVTSGTHQRLLGTSAVTPSFPGSAGIAVDTVNNEVYVNVFGGATSVISVYSPASSVPDPLPPITTPTDRTLTISGQAGQIAFDSVHGKLYVPVTNSGVRTVGSVQIYTRNASGPPTLSLTLTGPNNLLNYPASIALDTTNSKLYVLDYKATTADYSSWVIYRFPLSPGSATTAEELSMTPDSLSQTNRYVAGSLGVLPGNDPTQSRVFLSCTGSSSAMAIVQIYCGGYMTSEGSGCALASSGIVTTAPLPLRRLTLAGSLSTAWGIAQCN
jgi:fibronectin type 3 domain-containing protein